MTILVTGAGGFLGGHVIDLLIARGERPRALLLPDEPLPGPSAAVLDVHRGDVRDPWRLRSALRGVDCVVHCAAKTGPWGSYDEYASINVRAVEDLVRAAMSAGVRRVVHVSSVTVHGNDVGGDANEDTPFKEEPNPYSASKVAAERLLREMIDREGAPVTIVRPGWIYGPRDSASFGRVAARIEGRHMFLLGRGLNHLPLIYVRDAARGVLLAAEAVHAVGRTYVLVNPEPVTQRAYLATIAAQLGVPAPTKRVNYRLALTAAAQIEVLTRLGLLRAPPPVMRFGIQLLGGENRFSIERAQRELGFTPCVSMSDGVARSVRWYRAARATPRALVAA